jgi:protein involved in polysaccharide export with SLBB domain
MKRWLRLMSILSSLATLTACTVVESSPPPTLVRPPTTTFMRPAPPEEECFYLRGEVNVPGRYLIMGPAHVVEAVDAAGGLTPIADPRVIVSRRLDDGRLVRWVVSSDDVHAGLAPDPELVPEDVIDAIGLH